MLRDWFFKRHLEDDESIMLVVHRHWMLGVRYLFWPVFFFAVSWGFFIVYARALQIFAAVALWSIFNLVWMLRNYFDYYLDAWLITDQGIIDIAWHGWFHRSSSRVLYSDVQGVSYEIRGFLGTVLRYGDISVEKISTGNAIALADVPHPRRVEAAILQNMENYLHTKNLKDSKRVQEILAQMITNHLQTEEFEE